MHVADFGAEVALAAQEVEAGSAAGGEIDAGCSFGHLGIGKESAATKLEIRNHAAVHVQRPFERERVYANAVGGVRFLSNHEDRDGIHSIFQAAAQETRSVRRSEDQSVAEARVPYSVGGLAAINSAAPAGPHLQLMAALDRAGLRANCGRVHEHGKQDGC